ncbi:MAG: hypothetical protein MUQ91_05140 [Flavobacteriaceae bacterium]|jgi:outer membrane protein|nr:hypothetical protein [Flavobacteriaceae bacterium]MDO7581791.1 hypothetical protein [Flavobacteriaceae bacterium]|tara:strand:+ start:2890 stop:3123 length:234 start_codon:yes stop_codon:yes gene_type:complete
MKILTVLLLILSITTAFGQAKPSYNIGMLLDTSTTELDALTHRLEKQIKAVVGEDATINFPKSNILVNDFSKREASN